MTVSLHRTPLLVDCLQKSNLDIVLYRTHSVKIMYKKELMSSTVQQLVKEYSQYLNQNDHKASLKYLNQNGHEASLPSFFSRILIGAVAPLTIIWRIMRRNVFHISQIVFASFSKSMSDRN